MVPVSRPRDSSRARARHVFLLGSRAILRFRVGTYLLCGKRRTTYPLPPRNLAPGTQPVRPVRADEGNLLGPLSRRVRPGEMSRLFFAAFTLDHLPASRRVTRSTRVHHAR